MTECIYPLQKFAAKEISPKYDLGVGGGGGSRSLETFFGWAASISN